MYESDPSQGGPGGDVFGVWEQEVFGDLPNDVFPLRDPCRRVPPEQRYAHIHVDDKEIALRALRTYHSTRLWCVEPGRAG